MFLMSFLFDVKDDNGLFGLDVPSIGIGEELKTSKNWLKLKPTAAVQEPQNEAELANIIPIQAKWSNEGEMDSAALVIPSSPAGQPDDAGVGIWIAHRDGSEIVGADATMTVVVCFGRPSPAKQKRASPFQDLHENVRTTFVFPDQKSNRKDAKGNPAWYFPIGFVDPSSRPVGSKHKAHRFGFAVGVILKDGEGRELHYSHDPEMDVTT